MLATVRVLLSVAVSIKMAIPWGAYPSKSISLYSPRDLSEALLMARSMFSLGMFTALAFWITARSLELASGSGPPSLTAMTISLPILVKALAMADQRFIFRAFLNSNALPIGRSEER